VEDINNILNTAEIPNIFPADEKAELLELVRISSKANGKD
jgi:dynein heavy chain